MRGLAAVALTGFALWASPAPAQSNPAAAIYDSSDTEPLQATYQKGWITNYRQVLLPVLTAEERTQLERVQFRFEQRDAAAEPFGFRSAPEIVVASTASLKFLDDLSVATAWLHLNGFEQQTVADYMLMLRYWRLSRADQRPPKPLEALCIPADALADPRVDERANRIFDSLVVFVMLHELGHVRWGHRGYAGVTPEQARANEEAADRFALDILARINEAPLGLAVLFTAMAQLWENRADYASDEEYQRAAALHTHPLSPARLQSVAGQLAASGRGFVGDSRAIALNTALEISRLALLLADVDVQHLSSRIGKTVEPTDLAPRRRGQHLAAPCHAPASTGLPFDGTFRGRLQVGDTSLDLDAVLAQRDDRVTGSYSFGAGFARLDGSVSDAELAYNWTLPPDKGHGLAALHDGIIAGTWGIGTANSGAGTLSLTRPSRP